VDKKRAGLVGQKVVWGEMDSMVSSPDLTMEEIWGEGGVGVRAEVIRLIREV
jgi:hypothetical protein